MKILRPEVVKKSAMYRAIGIYIVCVALISTKCPPSYAQTTSTVKVLLRGMKSDVGQVRVALFSSNDKFPGDKPFRGASVVIRNGEAYLEFDDVPVGEYAISAFHDENDNAKLDFTVFGPTESYGFSNNARALFSPPPFDKAKVPVRKGRVTLVVDLQ
jgi:uncharacterized protein (DUF2141 family)